VDIIRRLEVREAGIWERKCPKSNKAASANFVDGSCRDTYMVMKGQGSITRYPELKEGELAIDLPSLGERSSALPWHFCWYLLD
jgi:hypothetical protein